MAKQEQLTTSWVWPVDNGFGIFGVHVDTRKRILHWFDSFECQCMDDGGFAEQTVEEYVRDGAPAGVSGMPEDVAAELRETTNALRERQPA